MDVEALETVLEDLKDPDCPAEIIDAKRKSLSRDAVALQSIASHFSDSLNDRSSGLAAEIVAELAKSDQCRASLQHLLVPLTELLKSQNSFNTATDVVYQALRAIGNICYENDDARNLFLEAGGIASLLETVAISHRTLDDPVNQAVNRQNLTVGSLTFENPAAGDIHGMAFFLGTQVMNDDLIEKLRWKQSSFS